MTQITNHPEAVHAQPALFADRPSESQSKSTPVNAKLIWHTVTYWWTISAPIGFIFAAIAGTVIYLTYVPEYRAIAVLQIQPPSNIVLRSLEDTRGYVQDQVEFLQSAIVLEQVLDKVDLSKSGELTDARDPLAELSDRVKVNSVGGSSFFRVEYQSQNAVFSANVTNAICDSYLNLRGDRENLERKRQIDVYERLRIDKDNEVAALQNRLINIDRSFLELGGSVPSTLQNVTVSPTLTSINSQLASAKFNQAELVAQLQLLKETLAKKQIEVSEADLSQAVDAHPEVTRIGVYLEFNHRSIDSTQEKMANYRNVVTDPSKIADYVRLEELVDKMTIEANDLRMSLKEKRKSVRAEVLDSLKARELRQKEELISRKQMEIDLARLKVEQLNKSFDAELIKARNFGSDAISQREILLLDLSQAKSLQGNFLRRLEELRLKGEIESVHLLRRAKTPILPVKFVPWLKIAMGGLAVFVVPFFLALLWESRVNRINDSTGIEDDAKIPIIGEIASLPTRRIGIRNGVRPAGIRLFEESIDSLRTSLMVAGQMKESRVFVIASAVSQEGKTSVASQLAISIARATGKRTLLVDGDMRSPDIHKVFLTNDQSEDFIGLVEVLAAEVDLADVVRETFTKNLDVLPAGHLRCSAHALVGNGHFKGFLNRAANLYEYILLDTPPLLAAAESVVMASHADASILCAMRGTSRLNQVRKAYRRLVQANADPAGIVLSGIRLKKYAYDYGEYYDRSDPYDQ